MSLDPFLLKWPILKGTCRTMILTALKNSVTHLTTLQKLMSCANLNGSDRPGHDTGDVESQAFLPGRGWSDWLFVGLVGFVLEEQNKYNCRNKCCYSC